VHHGFQTMRIDQIIRIHILEVIPFGQGRRPVPIGIIAQIALVSIDFHSPVSLISLGNLQG